ncbi:hypothetical protein [Streptomyces sp. URMC 123]|uniref:baeRF3 domain-containing protein n=1 Tax=Streptomyces sp. URMC 123 TaxID=3423403 RepID=UPI003F1BCAA2
MHTSELTPALLEDLRRPRPYPAVSLLMPTHRLPQERDQDRIRLRNLVAEGKKRIAAVPGLSRVDRIDLEERLDRTGAELELEHAEDGLLVLAAPGETHVWELTSPVEVPEQVMLAGTFLTRNLVAARLHTSPYWVLVLAEEVTRLWSGAGDRLTPVEDYGFPVEPEIPDHRDALPGPNFGNQPSKPREERLRQYARGVDATLGKVLAAERRPVFVVGASGAIARFEDVSENAKDIAGRLEKVGLDKASPHVLAEELRPVIAEHTATRTREAMDRLDAARGQKLVASGIDEVWEVAREGRGAMLLVEQHLRVAARVDDGHLDLARADGERGAAPDVAEDVVDQVVERVLDAGGEVQFVPDGTLEGDGRIALILRY